MLEKKKTPASFLYTLEWKKKDAALPHHILEKLAREPDN
jgi:hypothetical protein